MEASVLIQINSFKSLRPLKRLVAQVACAPYDVVDRAEALAQAQDNPLSFLHVSRAEIDLPENIDPYAEEVYAQSKVNFKNLRRRAFMREATPCLYLYRQRRGAHAQRGLVACCHVDDYERDLIKKHEKTRQDKEDDRTRHIKLLRAHGGLVFLTYRDHAQIDRTTAAIEATRPIYDFTASDQVQHTVWRIRQTQPLIHAFREVAVCYIADGHHRAASAARVARELGAANPAHSGQEQYNWFPAVLFPASQLQILPYNRCLRDLHGKPPAEFLSSLRARFKLTALSGPEPIPASSGRVSLYCAGQWYELILPAPTSADPVAALDASLLQTNLLGPILGVSDPRTDERLVFIGGIHGAAALKEQVDSGQAAVAFALFPTTLDQLMAIADAGQIMPPKSTWFEPKLRSGLLIHTF